jgi:hypothetical protein
MSTSILYLPVAYKPASKRLDVSGFHAQRSAASLLYLKRFKPQSTSITLLGQEPIF